MKNVAGGQTRLVHSKSTEGWTDVKRKTADVDKPFFIE